MKINVKIIHAFSVNGQGGNPAGVVFGADNLTPDQQQTIAAGLGFPESAFVSQSSVADFKLNFFTPVKQIPHCGHATIGTFTFLKQQGLIKEDRSSKETIDGTRQIVYIGKYAFMEQRAPEFLSLAGEAQAILSSLGLTLDDLQPGLFPTVVNTGNSFLVVPLKNEAALANIKLHRAQVVAISRQYGLIGFYPYAAADGENIQATTRMFGPYYGIEEEAGTGMAAGPLACFLYQFANKKRKRYLIEQGRFMDVPSRSLLHVHLKVEDGVIRNLFVGGDAFVKEERTIEI